MKNYEKTIIERRIRMKNELLGACIISVLILMFAGQGFTECFYGPTGVMHYDKDLAYNGYNLCGNNVVDMEGNILHVINAEGGALTVTEDGRTVSLVTSKVGINPSELVETGSNGEVVWKWTSPDSSLYFFHHDYEVIWNKRLQEYTVLAVCEQPVDTAVATAAGSDPDNDLKKGGSADSVLEIRMTPQDPNNPLANIIWEWKFIDHVVQYYDPSGVLPSGRSTYGDVQNPENDFGRLDLNVNTNQGPGFCADWNHINGLSYNADRDIIALSARENCEIFVIDHSLTTEEAAGPAGDFVYRWGNPYNYTKAEEDLAIINNNGHQQLFGNHHCKWVTPVENWEEGFVQTGEPHLNLLVFNNGSYNPTFTVASSIYEINPFDEYGNFVRETDAGYAKWDKNMPYGSLSNQVVWKFSSLEFGKFHQGFYSSHGSNVWRLPNGNTFVFVSETGHNFEVTPDLQIAWEYISPFIGGELVYRTSPGNPSTGAVTRVPYSYFNPEEFVKPNVVSAGVWDSEANLPGWLSGKSTSYEPKVYTGFGFSGTSGTSGSGSGGVGSGGGMGDVGGGY